MSWAYGPTGGGQLTYAVVATGGRKEALENAKPAFQRVMVLIFLVTGSKSGCF